MKVIIFLILFHSISFAQVPPEVEDFCSKTQRVKLSVAIDDPIICARYGKTAPCNKRCGWQIFSENCTKITWKHCKPIEDLFATPIPTASPNPCQLNDPNYCWQNGASLNPDGTCSLNCRCIRIVNPFLCAG